MAKSVVIRIIAFLTVILGMTVLAGCGWTLAITILHEETEPASDSNLNLTSIGRSPVNYTVFKMESEPNKQEGSGLGYEDGSWVGMSRRFKYLIQGCVGASIGIALFQLIVSMIVLCTSNKSIRRKTKLWQLSHFIIILLLLMCILVPLSYNREKDSFRGTLSFGKYMKTEIGNFYKILAQNRQNFKSFLMDGLNSYYMLLCLNVICLTTFLLFSCCLQCCCHPCRCCCCKRRDQYGSNYS